MSFLARKFGYIIALTVVCACGMIAFRGPQGVQALMEKRHEIRDLQEKNTDLAREVQAKRERIERLKNSRAEQELEIRNRLKLVRPGETTFVLPDKPAATPEASAQPASH